MIELVQGNTKETIDRLVRLDADAFGRGGLNEWHLLPTVRHGRVYVIRQEEEIVGSVQYILDWENPRKAYMIGVSVAKEWRGRGVGKNLLHQSFLSLYKQKLEEVELTVDPNNTAAVNLYRDKLGFRDVKFLTNEYGQGEDRLVMTLSLDKFVNLQSNDISVTL